MNDTREGIRVQPQGLLARFRNQTELLAAAKELRQYGLVRMDAFSPFPIHGMDQALGIPRSRLPFLVLWVGIAAGVAALGFQYWTNTVDYPFVVSGKPLFSLPANIPVAFEVIILAAAFAAFFGMLVLNGLPRLANPLFRSKSFLQVTDDGFFLFVDSSDELYDRARTAAALRGVSASHVEELEGVTDSSRTPSGIILVGIVALSLALLPPAVIASVRSTTSEKPRLHTFFDMDFQPKFKSQASTTLFADGRASRPRVEGTVSRRPTPFGAEFELGTTEANSPAHDLSTTDDVGGEPGPLSSWITQIPMEITTELMDRGRERFNIHCAVCHGRAGFGNGLASQRALELEQGTWVPPTSIHADYIREMPDGQIYNTITNGVRKMPAYGHQIPPKDRWAIVLYLRALQRSQRASLQDVPDSFRATLREMN
ncbi:MAG: DUF3341 domain-containing protein [Planctomycetaceae bacterium]|nr:DUF3341 domain-containing protein [Planctomycetaceae bacterium]